MSSPEAHIDPAVFEVVANHHTEVAEQIEASLQVGPEIFAAVQSYGPIMHQTKAAVADLLAAREQALRGHGDEHRELAGALRREAANYVAVDEDNAERLRLECR
jgi:Excreted virulence factor EspC, type VII ESX diderm